MSRLAQSLYDYVSEGESDEASKSEEYTKGKSQRIQQKQLCQISFLMKYIEGL